MLAKSPHGFVRPTLRACFAAANTRISSWSVSALYLAFGGHSWSACFGTLKQTLERCRLRSCTPRRALAELDWSVLGAGALRGYARGG